MTRLSDQFLCDDKEYVAQLHLGIATDTHDNEGTETFRSEKIPTLQEIHEVIAKFQGTVEQTPPMYSAKKVNGQKLYDLARKGKTIERLPVQVNLETTLLRYAYPKLEINVKCSKGTYIRTIADDMGQLLHCGAHLSALERTRSGPFKLESCLDGSLLFNPSTSPDLIRQKLFFPT